MHVSLRNWTPALHGSRADEFVFHASVCRGKVRYLTRSEAKHGAKRAMAMYDNDQRPYRCPVCNRWHLKTI